MVQIHVVEDYLRVKILKIVIYKPFYKQLQNNKLSAVNADPFCFFVFMPFGPVEFPSWHMPRVTRTVALEVMLGDSDG